MFIKLSSWIIGKYLQASKQINLALKNTLLLMCCSTFVMTLPTKDSHFKFWPLPCSSLTSLFPSYDCSFQVQIITLLISTFRLVQYGSGTFWRGDCNKKSFCWLQYLSQVQLFLKEEERISMLETAFLLRFVIMQYLLSLQIIGFALYCSSIFTQVLLCHWLKIMLLK